ncbi:peptidoglycan DD-metalloendopeptidase family protein [Sutcliffiella horikoshii]|uniref:peptidoglycan DD-metalloendopeptidase family protein n=1 Tax=Sutcliffiella horikoshii TaxID=79883 RepID=UPI002041021A|nr:peptidoglycan DD-metalloendopeptidase family protein [Sutcliffiella horikoshii]MCM3617959.1 peptidoglycan DD-metalloendopeptidase family protein [Sutcliffiella horikoshii]
MREEEKKRTSQNSNWQRLMKKRWVFPAIYLGCAAIILTAVLMFQAGSETDGNPGNSAQPGQGPNNSYGDQDSVEVNSPVENFVMPVTDVNSSLIQKPFWDENGSKDEQEAAFIEYNGRYQPNTGIDIVMKDGETFDVVASLSGTVTHVENDPILGNVVEIEHLDGVKTIYQSLTDVQVKVNDFVEQGATIAKAHTNKLNKDSVHVHFEIRKDNVAVNPISFFNKPVTSLLEEEGQASEEGSEPAGEQEKEETPAEGEDKPEDGEDKDGDEGSSDEEKEESVSYLT